MLAKRAIATTVWMGCEHATWDMASRLDVMALFNQLSVWPKERSCLGRSEEPRILDVRGRRPRSGEGGGGYVGRGTKVNNYLSMLEKMGRTVLRGV